MKKVLEFLLECLPCVRKFTCSNLSRQALSAGSLNACSDSFHDWGESAGGNHFPSARTRVSGVSKALPVLRVVTWPHDLTAVPRSQLH